MSKFIPRVILLGEKSRLPRDLSTEFQIVGNLEIEVVRENVVNFFLDHESVEFDEIYSRDFDYILCTEEENLGEWSRYLQALEFPSGRFASMNFFRHHVSNIGFVSLDNVSILMQIIQATKNSNLILDADAYFFRGNAFNFSSALESQHRISIDAVAENPDKIEPIFFNIYDRIFKSLDEVRLRSYDLIVFTAERSIEEWLEILNWASESSRAILAFIHCNSPALPILKNDLQSDFSIEWIGSLRGEWMLLKNERPKSFRSWIAIHQKYSMPKIPEGYEWLHVGKKLATIDLGFRGDDSGDNISALNSKINELTALYWVWKNFPTDYVGFAHYRRYFVAPGDGEVMLGKNREHIISVNEVTSQLKNFDIIVDFIRVYFTPQNFVEDDVYHLVKKHLQRVHPEDVELFERRIASPIIHSKSMFFTRWKVFAAYCEWLFPFILPAAMEFKPSKPEHNRQVGYLSELMLTMFLMKHNLRVKNLKILESNKKFFDAEDFTRHDQAWFD